MTLIKKTGEKILLKAADVRARLGPPLDRVQARRAPRRPPARAARRPASPWSCPGSRATSQAPLLQKLAANGTWVPSVKVAPDDDGSFAVTVRPKATATYRLTADGQVGPALTITVPAGPAK